jgi:hypothetical protein
MSWFEPSFVWGIPGTLVGGGLTLLGSWIQRRSVTEERKETERRMAGDEAARWAIGLRVYASYLSHDFVKNRDSYDNPYPSPSDDEPSIASYYRHALRAAYDSRLDHQARSIAGQLGSEPHRTVECDHR